MDGLAYKMLGMSKMPGIYREEGRKKNSNGNSWACPSKGFPDWLLHFKIILDFGFM